MRYRREDANGDYTFGGGDNTFLTDSPECVAQAIKTRFALWRGQWFLDLTEGTPYMQSVLGKQHSDVYTLAIRERIQDTPGVLSILSFSSHYDETRRRVTFTSSVNTPYGQTTVTSEA